MRIIKFIILGIFLSFISYIVFNLIGADMLEALKSTDGAVNASDILLYENLGTYSVIVIMIICIVLGLKSDED